MNGADGIYEQYADEVLRFLLCMTADAALAEELTQETFYQAVKSINRYNGECKMSVWLCQIAKHAFYNHLSKQKRRGEVSFDAMIESLGETLFSDTESPEEALERRELQKRIYREIHRLGEPYREVFLLRSSTDMSFALISEVFDKSENWARVTYYRAKIKLSERMDINGD